MWKEQIGFKTDIPVKWDFSNVFTSGFTNGVVTTVHSGHIYFFKFDWDMHIWYQFGDAVQLEGDGSVLSLHGACNGDVEIQSWNGDLVGMFFLSILKEIECTQCKIKMQDFVLKCNMFVSIKMLL